MSVLSLQKPNAISDSISWPAPVVMTIGNWLAHEDELDPEKRALMKQLLEKRRD
jgi:hypothetical protein